MRLRSLLVVCALARAASAQIAVEDWSWLTENQEVPATGSQAVATADLTLNLDDTLTYSLQATGLVGTVAHIHLGAMGVNGPIQFLLAGGPTAWSGTTPPLTQVQLDALEDRELYINIHTAGFPNGEIRG